MEKSPVGFVLMEVLRHQHGRDDGYLVFELKAHQRADHRFGDELVAIDAAVDDEAGAELLLGRVERSDLLEEAATARGPVIGDDEAGAGTAATVAGIGWEGPLA